MSDPTAPLIELRGVSKQFGAAEPLRLAHLVVSSRDRLALSGLDAGAAEMFVLLVTGAALPDAGEVRVAGRPTAEIRTDVDWLASLDRFGLVTNRAVLIDKLPTAANMALPFTLSIDPMSEETRARVEALAREAGLQPHRLDAAAGDLSPVERLRVHLARALALDPALLLLEHPTAAIAESADAADYGTTLRTVAAARDIGWIAITDDARFSRASGAARWRLVTTTGEIRRAGSLWDRFK